jgi:hypothetical protein
VIAKTVPFIAKGKKKSFAGDRTVEHEQENHKAK